MIEFTIRLRTVNELNSHEHWRKRQRRAKAQRWAANATAGARRDFYELTNAPDMPGSGIVPLTVTLTRVAPSLGLDPHDGLPASCKHIADGIADALGIDDRDGRVTWVYAQARGKAREYAVRVRLEAR